MAAISFPEGINCQGDFRKGGTLTPGLTRAELIQENLAVYPIEWTAWRVWNAFSTNLPSTPLADDLGLVAGAFGTNSPSIRTEDLKNAGATTSYARCQVILPPEYVAGETVKLRFHAGMITTVASASATIDASLYKSDGESGISADLVTTGATTINSTSLADKDFEVTSSALSPGDVLDLRIAIAISDSATGTAVIGCVGAASLLLDIRG